MNELVKLAAAAIVVKQSSPDWLRKLFGQPTSAMLGRQKIFKTLLPILGIGTMGALAYKHRDRISELMREALEKEPQIQAFINDTGQRGRDLITDLFNARQLDQYQGLRSE